MARIRLLEYSGTVEDLVRVGRLDEAIAHCRNILQLYPKHVETYRLLGDACQVKGLYPQAREFFQRTLSADPENLAAWMGLGGAYDAQGMLPEAIWPVERAFELSPGDLQIRRELQRLYARRDPARHGEVETGRLELTRGALGRLYARSGLGLQAIGEFRAILAQTPTRPDIRVALIEALWREGRHLEAVEESLEILEILPNCLKANLILGAIRLRAGHAGEADTRLNVVRALDPENLIACQVMGTESPLPSREVLVPLLEAQSSAPLAAQPGEELPHWVRQLELFDAEKWDRENKPRRSHGTHIGHRQTGRRTTGTHRPDPHPL